MSIKDTKKEMSSSLWNIAKNDNRTVKEMSLIYERITELYVP